MISIAANIEWHGDRMHAAMSRASESTHRQVAHDVMRTAQSLIVTSDRPSSPGDPPHTRGRGAKSLRSIRYDATKEDAIVGPLASAVGDVGAAHEFGEVFRGFDYPERPFMGPALQKNIDTFAQAWNGSFED